MSDPQRHHSAWGKAHDGDAAAGVEYVYCEDSQRSDDAVSSAIDIIMRHGEGRDFSDTS